MGPVKAGKGWAERVRQARADYQAWQKPTTSPGNVQMAEIMAWLARTLPADAGFCNGAGNYATWLPRFHRSRRHTGHLAPHPGSMGYGLAVPGGQQQLGRQR